MNSWWPTSEGALVSVLCPVCSVLMWVSVPLVIDRFQCPLFLWFSSPTNTKANSLCCGMGKPRLGVLQYIIWHCWSDAPYTFAGSQKMALSIAGVTVIVSILPISTPSGPCFAVAGKTKHALQWWWFLLPKLGRPYPLFSHMWRTEFASRTGAEIWGIQSEMKHWRKNYSDPLLM